ncbi:uncharacterized protein MELLADRAFT_65703 [Melampsora larici-populina 98AG31]|uniref:Uncharacterized protein n=1 Tax=Melampsora larici-populina (strain 98AG31 / pathotype 3-4-7) TaxID=747676 RepID=F4RWE7_MELLP|nr:uncharacterized protein MELLADRAFT_65703 [Melampsora larici-populina 98AG31]EGG03335.1 hypothetical protein MELLADRAFT_65703 [Melampsora larici-populina 98AG31]
MIDHVESYTEPPKIVSSETLSPERYREPALSKNEQDEIPTVKTFNFEVNRTNEKKQSTVSFENKVHGKTPLITTKLKEPIIQTKSIKDIIRETEDNISPFVAAGPVREQTDNSSNTSFDKHFSLNKKFQALQLQTESLSPKSIPSIIEHKEDISSMMKNLQRSLEHKLDNNIRLLSEKWDFGINMLNDELNLNFDDIKTDVTKLKEGLRASEARNTCGDCKNSLEQIIEAYSLTCKQVVEIHSTHLSEMMCRLGEKLDNQAHQIVLLHMNVTRMISMMKTQNNLNDNISEQALGNNPFAEARSWYTVKRRGLGKRSWDEWKKMIMDHFGTPIWKRKMATAFDRDTFKWENREKPTAWLLMQRRRMDAAWPFLTIREQIDKVLGLCNGDIEHAVQSRISDHSDFKSFVNIFQEVVTNTSIGKTLQKTKDYRNYNFSSREKTSSFRDYKASEHPKPTEVGKYKDYRPSRPSGNSPARVSFRNDTNKGSRFEKKSINVISNEMDEEQDDEEKTEMSEEQEHRGTESSDDDENGLCIGNIDMMDQHREQECLATVSEATEETVQVQTPTLSIEDLAKNLRIAEEVTASVNPPPFLERRNFDNAESRAFIAVTISGFSSHMLLNTGIEPSIASTKILNKYWPTWPTDMKTTGTDELDVLGEVSMPIKLEHVYNPCFLMIKFTVLRDDELDHLILGSRDLREFGFSLYLGGRTRSKHFNFQ